MDNRHRLGPELRMASSTIFDNGATVQYDDMSRYILHGDASYICRLAADEKSQRAHVYFLVDSCIVQDTLEPLVLMMSANLDFNGLSINTHRGETRNSLLDFVRYRLTYGLDEWIKDGVLKLSMLHVLLDVGWIDEDAFLHDDDELIYGPYFLYEICIARAFMSSQENICNALVRWCASRNVKLTNALRWQQLLNYLERLDQQKDDDAISIDTPDSNMSEDEDL